MRVFLLFLLFVSPSFASEETGYLNIGNEKIFLRYREAAKGEPTFVMLNGLTYTTKDWQHFSLSLKRKFPKAGILLMDLRGMGDTLLAGKLPVDFKIPHTAQVEIVKKVTDKLEVERLIFVGFSYGGGIAAAFQKQFPKKVEKVFLLAPFTEALEDQDRFIRTQVQANRFAFPFNPASEDDLYDYFLRNFIYAMYPVAEPSVLENPYRLEAIFRLAQGIRQYKVDPKSFTAGSVHLLIANEDQYVPKKTLVRFWDSLPISSRGSRIDISVTNHKIPETSPEFTVAWIDQIMEDRIEKGKVFEGNTRDFTARSGNTVIRLR